MHIYRSIVVALDDFPADQWPLDLAADLARQANAKLTLVHAYFPIRTGLGETYAPEIVQQRIARGERVLEAACAEVRDLDPSCYVVEGPATDAILQVAQKQQADLIVLGMGYGKVLQRAPCPVVLAHASRPVAQYVLPAC